MTRPAGERQDEEREKHNRHKTAKMGRGGRTCLDLLGKGRKQPAGSLLCAVFGAPDALGYLQAFTWREKLQAAAAPGRREALRGRRDEAPGERSAVRELRTGTPGGSGDGRGQRIAAPEYPAGAPGP